MKVGIPRGLLYPKYKAFARTFLEEIGAEIVLSPDTNKSILDEGVSLCVDEACLPMKVFHGHVSWLKNKCDALFIPRFMSIKKREHICPMFCGLIEMLKHNIGKLPPIIDTPIYSFERANLREWAIKVGREITQDERLIGEAFDIALNKQLKTKVGFNDQNYELKIGLIGHVYNVNDKFVNMEIKKKLNSMGVGVATSEYVDQSYIETEISELFKKPFWTYAQEYYGAAVTMYKKGVTDGLIYLSSFSCGIDSVVTELIKNEVGDFPYMILKLDEHTGIAGFNTRLEAFSDMLKRRKFGFGINVPQYGQCGVCRPHPMSGA